MTPRSLAGLAALALVLAPIVTTAADSDTSLESWMAGGVASGKVLSGVVALVRGDQVDVKGYGRLAPDDDRPPDGETLYEIGSITKVFTNLLLAELAARDEVAYDSTLAEVWGEGLEPRNPEVGAITLEQLATHASGLPRLPGNLMPVNAADPYAGYDAEALLRGVNVARDLQPLSRRYAYSNFGVGLLGHLLGQVTGEGYHRSVDRQVLKPLGLGRTGFFEDDNLAAGYRNGEVVPAWGFDDALVGAGGLRACAGDLVRLAQVYLGYANHRMKHDLAADLAVVADGPGSIEVTRVWHVGRAGDAPIFWHSGGTGGYWSFVGFRPDTEQALVVLVSGDPEPTNESLAALGHTGVDEPDPVDRSLFGQYDVSPLFGIGVFEEQGALVAQATGQPSLPIERVDDQWYRYTTVDASLKFLRGDDGEVEALEVAQNGRLLRAERVAEVAEVVSRKAIEVPAGELGSYVGRYRLAPRLVFDITLRDGQLAARLTGQPALPVFPQGEDVFFYRVVDAELHFERDEEGKVDALVLHQAGMQQRAPRIAGDAD